VDLPTTLQRAADELYSYHCALDNVLYSMYSKEELGKKLALLDRLQQELENLADSDLIVAQQVMEI